MTAKVNVVIEFVNAVSVEKQGEERGLKTAERQEAILKESKREKQQRARQQFQVTMTYWER